MELPNLKDLNLDQKCLVLLEQLKELDKMHGKQIDTANEMARMLMRRREKTQAFIQELRLCSTESQFKRIIERRLELEARKRKGTE